MCVCPTEWIASKLNCIANNERKMHRKLKRAFIDSDVLMYFFYPFLFKVLWIQQFYSVLIPNYIVKEF